jgi:hypothetical protein
MVYSKKMKNNHSVCFIIFFGGKGLKEHWLLHWLMWYALIRNKYTTSTIIICDWWPLTCL